MPKLNRKGNKRRPERKRGQKRSQKARNGNSKGATLVLKTHIMLQASINTAVSFVKQINITPYLGLFPVALQQSKFYQQYRISRVRYLVLPASTTNTNTTAASFSTPLYYSIPLFNSSIPGANESAYLAYKNVQISTLTGMRSGSFVPFVPTSEQTTNAQVMVRSPRISTKQTNPLHFGHSLLFVEQSFNAFAFIRVLVQCTFEFYHFDGQKASLNVQTEYDQLRQRMSAQIAPDLQTHKRLSSTKGTQTYADELQDQQKMIEVQIQVDPLKQKEKAAQLKLKSINPRDPRFVEVVQQHNVLDDSCLRDHGDLTSPKILPLQRFPWQVLGQQRSPPVTRQQFEQLIAEAQSKTKQVWRTPKLIRK